MENGRYSTVSSAQAADNHPKRGPLSFSLVCLLTELCWDDWFSQPILLEKEEGITTKRNPGL